MRKVQLEAEVARLERVRAVWLETRRGLHGERALVAAEIRRMERRQAQWAQAQAVAAAHPHEPFCTDVATAQGDEMFAPIMHRAEAGAAVRQHIHTIQSDAAFQRQRLRGVVARYRGLDLVVQAHATFAAKLSLALPDGTILDTVSAETDSGLWQSVGHLIGEIPAILERAQARITQARERIATIDRELARLEQWDAQERYDAAASELRAISAAFAAAEEQAGSPEPTAAPTPEESDLAMTLLALAQADAAGDDGGWAPVIPPAPASLAWMAAQEAPVEPSVCPAPLLARPAAPRRPIAPMPASGETFQQLSLFG